MLFKIAICDDEEKQIKIIEDYLTKFSIKTGVEFIIERFTSSELLLKKYFNETSPFDILFLDMEMPVHNGMEIAKMIRNIPDRNVLISFVTSYPEYMQDSFDVQASQYFTKPVSYDLFEEKIRNMIMFICETETNITVVSQKKGEIVIHLDDVVCIETSKPSGLIVTNVKEEIFIKGKLSDYEKELSDKYFINVHRTCLANMRYIKRFNSDSLEFSTGKTVNVSRRRFNEIKEAFSRYMVMRYKR